MENTHDTPSGRTCRARYQAIRDETSSPSSVRSSKPPVATELMYLNLGGGGKTRKPVWRNAGCVVGEGYSVAWRMLDAQYWGVPQRRRRIFLVCDFAGERAGEILFKREGLRGNFAQSREAGKEAAADAVGSTGGDCRAFHLQQDPISGRVSPCIGAQHQATVGVVYDITGENSNSLKSRTPDSCFRERTVARTLDTFSGSPECNQGGNVVVFDARGNGDGQIVPTITGDHENRVTDYTALAVGNGQLNQIYMTDTAGTLTCSHDQQMICAFMGGQGAKAGGIAEKDFQAFDLVTARMFWTGEVSPHVIEFCLQSDCGGFVTWRACRKLLKIIGDYDDELAYGYAARPNSGFKDFKRILEDCVKHKCSMRWR